MQLSRKQELPILGLFMSKPSIQKQFDDLQRENAALKQELEIYKRFTQSVRVGLWRLDLRTDKLILSKLWWQGLGYEDHEIPKTFSQLLLLTHKDDRFAVEEFNNPHSTSFRKDYTFRLRAKQGEYRNILLIGIRNPSEAPDLTEIAGVHADITDEQTANRKSARLIRFYECVLNTMPHLILIKDTAGKFVYANNALAQFYGAESANSMIGKTDSDYNKNNIQVNQFHRDDMEVIRAGRQIAISRENNTDCNGIVHFLQTIKAPLKYLDGSTYVVTVATFIDELVNTQDHLLAVKEREKKLGVIQQLAGQMSHKLNTRIATVENRVLLVAKQDSPHLDSTFHALDDIKRFAADFLQLSLANKLKYSTTNLWKIIHSAINMTENDSSIIIVNEMPWKKLSKTEKSYPLVADEPKLLDVFTELISNSIRWRSRNEHKISINVALSSLHMTPAFGPPPALDCLTVTFQDNGPGIQYDLKKRIFEPFFSTRPEGTGLGLTIVRDVIEAHGGRITEVGLPGKGACFQITLPTSQRS